MQSKSFRYPFCGCFVKITSRLPTHHILLNTDNTSAAATHSPDELISAPALLGTVLDYEKTDRLKASKREA